MNMLLGDSGLHSPANSPARAQQTSDEGALVAHILEDAINIFDYADVDNDGKLSELEFWENLPKLFDLMQVLV